MKEVCTRRETMHRFLFTLALTVLFLSLCYFTHRDADHLLPRGTEYAAARITFADLVLSGAEVPEAVLAGRRDGIGFVGTGKPGGAVSEVRIALVNRAYFEMQPLTLLQGGIPDDLRNGPYVLIGDNLACRLFLTLDCIGNRFSVDGQTVSVAGVYAEPRSLLHRISGDGRELVWLLAGPETADAKPEQVFLCTADGANVREETFHQLNTLLPGGLRADSARDWEAGREGLTQLTQVCLFLFRLVIAVFLLRPAVRYLRRFPAWCREYVQAEEANASSILRRLLPPILCIVAAIVLLMLFRPHIIIPAELIPEGNRLLDLRHYQDIFVNNLVKHNTASYSYGSLIRYYGIRLICFSGVGMLLSLLRLLNLLRHCLPVFERGREEGEAEQ